MSGGARANAAVITGLGANTSLGGASGACAAIRAGVSRPAPLDAVAFDPAEGEVPVVGHPVRPVDGFRAEARLLSLAIPAVRELAGGAPLPSGRLALCVALPDLAARCEAAGAPPSPDLGLVARLVQLTGVAVPPALRFEFRAGPSGVAQALGAALALLAEARASACIVGGVDSLCDPAALEALAAERRLKMATQPVGLQPGEAAAFAVVEPAAAARRRNARALASLTGVAVVDRPPRAGAPADGRGLLAAIQRLVAASGPLPAGGTWFAVDRNGETERASDWAYCQHHLAAHLSGVLPAREWDVAESVGDTGAASAALAVQAVVRSFVRGYAPARCAVILSSGDGERRAALRIEGGDP